MIIVIGLVILVAALVAGVAGVLGNGGSAHALTHPFRCIRLPRDRFRRLGDDPSPGGRQRGPDSGWQSRLHLFRHQPAVRQAAADPGSLDSEAAGPRCARRFAGIRTMAHEG